MITHKTEYSVVWGGIGVSGDPGGSHQFSAATTPHQHQHQKTNTKKTNNKKTKTKTPKKTRGQPPIFRSNNSTPKKSSPSSTPTPPLPQSSPENAWFGLVIHICSHHSSATSHHTINTKTKSATNTSGATTTIVKANAL